MAKLDASDAIVFGISIDSPAANANAENDGVRSVELGHISLIGLKFLRSTLGKRQNVESQNHIFLAAVIAELHLLPVIVEQSEIRRHVAGLQARMRYLDILLRANRRDQTGHQGCRHQ